MTVPSVSAATPRSMDDRLAPATTGGAAALDDGAGGAKTKPWAEEDFSFGDLLDIINPLQHIPLINGIYRDLTGDNIGYVAKLAGGTLFGAGVPGLITSFIDVAVEDSSGKDIGEHVLAMLRDSDGGATLVAEGGDDGTQDKPAATAQATGWTNPDLPDGQPVAGSAWRNPDQPATADANPLPAAAPTPWRNPDAEAATVVATAAPPVAAPAEALAEVQAQGQPAGAPVGTLFSKPLFGFQPPPPAAPPVPSAVPPVADVAASGKPVQLANAPWAGLRNGEPKFMSVPPRGATVVPAKHESSGQSSLLQAQALAHGGGNHPMARAADHPMARAAAADTPGADGTQPWFASAMNSALDKYEQARKLREPAPAAQQPAAGM